MYRDRTGLLIIRAWVEQGSDEPLRASVRHTTDVSVGIEHAATLTDADATADMVRLWLREVLSARRPVEDTNPPADVGSAIDDAHTCRPPRRGASGRCSQRLP